MNTATKIQSLSLWMMVIVMITITLIVPLFASADIPVNCMYDDVVPGLWTFSLGPIFADNSKINCSEPFQVMETISTKLGYPDVVYDTAGNKGSFTLVYNQGFEVRLNGRKYFSFFAYDWFPNNDTSVSHCNRTYIGWAHNDDQSNWQCYTGLMQSVSSQQQHGNNAKRNADLVRANDPERLSTLFRNDAAFIEAINHAQSSWTARAYPQFEGLTIGDLERRAGGHATTSVREHMLNAFQSMTSSSLQPRVPVGFNPKLIPTSFDWRNSSGKNFVSPVRDQGGCGSCYIFSSLGMLEARVRVQTGNQKTPVFSPQEVTSCSVYSQGCAGGFPYLIGGKYAQDFGIVEESCFPYVGSNVPCSQTCTNESRWKVVEDYYYVGGYYGATTAELMQWEIMQNGPISVSFEVYDDFMSYSSGIYVHNATSSLLTFNPFVVTNHAVLAVGWGELNGQRYWIVKNSWGDGWGMDGYFWIARDTGVYGGECGIESLAVAATVRV